ncbi:MAG: hypothetical protein EU539_11440 [Promethearchaeota archaeon]|nr:MAG: hypothetical protein EU539_11440 [Candidatus Lokiarchaeota archaeon]
MSKAKKKIIHLNIKDLSFKSEQAVVDLLRYLAEALPQIEINREGFEVEIKAPLDFSKRIIRLRIKKFLYKKGLAADYRPISLRDMDKDGYTVKEKKLIELTYY